VALVGNTLEVVENNRFRVMTEPLLLTLLAAWLAVRGGDPVLSCPAPTERGQDDAARDAVKP
jgi:hypothetical protein